jgi:hypothetical protein
MKECDAIDDEGRQCERTDQHTMHRAPTEWSFVTWGEPDPVRVGKRKKRKGASNKELLDLLHQATGGDRAESHRLTEDAIQMVDSILPDSYRARYREAVISCARAHEEFMVDHVWDYLEGPLWPESRVMGPIMREVASDGFIESTGRIEKSTLPQCHGNGRTVWRSLVHAEG